MTDVDQQRAWLRLLEEELGRRTARVAWDAGQVEREREAFVAELREMASRLTTAADRHPPDIADMSLAEQLAIRWFWPKKMRPPGLPTEAQIWAEYRARKTAEKARSGER